MGTTKRDLTVRLKRAFLDPESDTITAMCLQPGLDGRPGVFSILSRRSDTLGSYQCSEAPKGLRKFVKWNGFSLDGPRDTYIKHTQYLAGTRDRAGRADGDRFGKVPVYFVGKSPFGFKPTTRLHEWYKSYGSEIVKLPLFQSHSSYSYTPGLEWNECEFESMAEAEAFKRAVVSKDFKVRDVPQHVSSGKSSDPVAARAAAYWPTATLGQLQSEEALRARLPKTIKQFKRAMKEAFYG